MVSRSTRPPGLTQISGTSRVEQALKAVIEFLQPFAQPEEWTPLDTSTADYRNYTTVGVTGLAPAASKRDAMGRVWLRGSLEQVSGGNTLGVLPVAHRPAYQYSFSVFSNTGLGYGYVTPDGLLIYSAGGTAQVSLDLISFPTEA